MSWALLRTQSGYSSEVITSYPLFLIEVSLCTQRQEFMPISPFSGLHSTASEWNTSAFFSESKNAVLQLPLFHPDLLPTRRRVSLFLHLDQGFIFTLYSLVFEVPELSLFLILFSSRSKIQTPVSLVHFFFFILRNTLFCPSTQPIIHHIQPEKEDKLLPLHVVSCLFVCLFGSSPSNLINNELIMTFTT